MHFSNETHKKALLPFRLYQKAFSLIYLLFTYQKNDDAILQMIYSGNKIMKNLKEALTKGKKNVYR